MSETNTHDVVIVGGGVVGLSCALMLAKFTALSIGLIESKTPPAPLMLQDYHPRVSAFALSSLNLFKNLNVWPSIADKRVGYFSGIEVWAEKFAETLRFDSNEIAESYLGAIIENPIIEKALYEALQTFPAVKLLHSINLQSLLEKEDGVYLETNDQRQFKAQLLIAADGSHSWVRQAAAINITHYDYAQQAIVATVQTEKPHLSIARQVFLSTGPLALLPLDHPHYSSLVWSCPNAKAEDLKKLDEHAFKEALQQAFGVSLGQVVNVANIFSFPLKKILAADYVKSRIALVGDAAHTLHPLAGQGVNIGLLDAASLFDVIKTGLQRLPIEKIFTQLSRYARWRKADNLALLAGVHWLHGLMQSNSPSLNYLSAVGWKGVQHSQWLQNIFMRHAVGDRRGLPNLLHRNCQF